MGAGLVTPLVLIAVVTVSVCPPLKKASAANGATAGPPELIWYAGVPPTGLTTSVTEAECDKLPLVPLMVSVYVPAAVELLVETLSVDVPAPLTEAGVKVAVAPAGTPLTPSDTAPVKPFTALTVAV